MSEEEKKTIKYLEFLINEKCECDACQSAKKKYKTILNLLDKQKEEIEEKTTILLAGAKKVKQLEKEIEERDRYNITTLPFEELKEMVEQNKNISIFGKEYISKDKIREFIKKELPDDEAIKYYTIWNVNGIDLRKKLEKLLEEN